jgi:acetylornithine/succinyldiaminopimelate/putrescine aminotransferase
LGGGLPLGAFCGSQRLIGELAHDPPLGHITTFGGHPLSCAAGLAALEVIVDERMWEQANALGEKLVQGLRGFVGAEVAAVRVIGALIGLEFKSSETAQTFVSESLARGVIINWTLNAERVVRLAPPLNMGPAEMDFGLQMMAQALDASRVIGDSRP